MTIDITANAMIVTVNLGVWTGFKLDREAGVAAAKDAGAGDANAFRVNKLLVAKELLDPIATARNAIRTHTMDRTSPWDDNGGRLLARKMYQKFIEEHAPLEQVFFDKVGLFVPAYASGRAQAEFRLGSRFNAADYPHPDEVRAKFYCRIEIKPVPRADDFRVTLGADTDAIQKQIEEAYAERVALAQADVWQRIEKCVTHFAGRMAAQLEEPEEGKRRAPLHQSTIDNLIHLVGALPALNICGDPAIKDVGKRLIALLKNYNNANDMKGKPEVCAAARDAVREIMDELGWKA
jgi:hypothetical protein